MPTPSPLAPVFGLPQHGTTAEELRVLSLLTEARRGLSFAALARASADAMATYAALFALLTRGTVVSAELPGGEVGYRRRAGRKRRQAPAAAQAAQPAQPAFRLVA